MNGDTYELGTHMPMIMAVHIVPGLQNEHKGPRDECTQQTYMCTHTHTPMIWLYTLYRGSKMNCTKERSLPARPGGGFRLNCRVSS